MPFYKIEILVHIKPIVITIALRGFESTVFFLSHFVHCFYIRACMFASESKPKVCHRGPMTPVTILAPTVLIKTAWISTVSNKCFYPPRVYSMHCGFVTILVIGCLHNAMQQSGLCKCTICALRWHLVSVVRPCLSYRKYYFYTFTVLELHF